MFVFKIIIFISYIGEPVHKSHAVMLDMETLLSLINRLEQCLYIWEMEGGRGQRKVTWENHRIPGW